VRLNRHPHDDLYLRLSCFNFGPTFRLSFSQDTSTMTILKLHIDYTNPLTKEVYGNYSNWKLFCILRRYLEPRKRSLSLKEAVTLIYNILIPVIPGKPVEYPVEAFGFVILSVARQVPYFHISQDRFVRLLEQVHQFIELDLTNKLEVCQITGWDSRAVSNIPNYRQKHFTSLWKVWSGRHGKSIMVSQFRYKISPLKQLN
jgi:hypothetical protein